MLRKQTLWTLIVCKEYKQHIVEKKSEKIVLTLKAPITTAANEKF